MRKTVVHGALAMLVLGAATLALAQTPSYLCVDPNNPCHPKCGGPVNVSGATLFDQFFRVPASTNDFIDADCDGVYSPTCDQLATNWNPNGQFWWIMQDRAVGSGNGLAEFVESNLVAGWTAPNAAGYINRTAYDPNSAGPFPPEIIHLAIMDVPTTWFVRQSGTTAWDRRPVQPGYGNYAQTSWNSTQSNKLKTLTASNGQSLNLSLSAPDARTVYDTEVAWVPIAIIGNIGAGVENIRATELQHLNVTGRMPNGENLVGATRDSGSGTRNGAMNCLCVDPSWARGDNLGRKTDENDPVADPLGPQHQDTHLGGSSRMEGSVQNSRLAIGYTGLVGSSRAIGDANAGNYEILNVMFDVRGGTTYVRPSLQGLVHNCSTAANPWQVGGNETFASLGSPIGKGDMNCDGVVNFDDINPFVAILAGAAPCDRYNADVNNDKVVNFDDINAFVSLLASGSAPVPMDTGAARDYLINIIESIAAFQTAPGDPNNACSPGEFLATAFSLTGAIDCVPDPLNPCDFIPNVNLNPTLQQFTLTWNPFSVPAYGSKLLGANKTPVRVVLNPANPLQVWPPDTCDCPYPPDYEYSDGSTDGKYHNPHKAIGIYDISGGSALNPRNKLSGDFNGDGLRNLNDVEYLVQAYYDRYVMNDKNYTTYLALPGVNSTLADPVVPEIIGDFTGDGNFDCRDVRYFLDGLAIDLTTGRLDRGAAFLRADQAWGTLTGTPNLFGTVRKDAGGNTLAWVAGASAGDVAGSTPWPGAMPHGYDCIVDAADIAYVTANQGVWANLNEAVVIDLSCDLNGDLVIDAADVTIVTGWTQ